MLVLIHFNVVASLALVLATVLVIFGHHSTKAKAPNAGSFALLHPSRGHSEP